MTKAAARREAQELTAGLVRGQLSAGWPFGYGKFLEMSECDQGLLVAALNATASALEKEARWKGPRSWYGWIHCAHGKQFPNGNPSEYTCRYPRLDLAEEAVREFVARFPAGLIRGTKIYRSQLNPYRVRCCPSAPGQVVGLPCVVCGKKVPEGERRGP